MNDNNLAKLLLHLWQSAKVQSGYTPGLTRVGIRIYLREGCEPSEWITNDVGDPSYPGLVVILDTDEKPTGRYGIGILDPKLLEFMGDRAHDEMDAFFDGKAGVMLRLDG